jgi:hypothetical protein
LIVGEVPPLRMWIAFITAFARLGSEPSALTISFYDDIASSFP